MHTQSSPTSLSLSCPANSIAARGATWEERRDDECNICQKNRRKRCRVLNSTTHDDVQEAKFADAPLIHPWNAPKYHAALVRAKNYARRTEQILLWAIAEDTPLSSEHRNLDEDELDAKRHEWALYHDQKTAGIMGLQPFVKDMPMRITQTDSKNKKIIFKNRRCRLHGWKLHEVDLARLEACSSPEMELKYLPEEIFLRIPKATWVVSADLGPGVISLKPVIATWHIDKMCQIGIRRKGFTVASDFSGTAHSFAGDNLRAAVIDCLPWATKPDKSAQIGAYMSISRVRATDDIYITQPYAPTLFSQGDLPGPELLLKFQRRELDISQLKEAWDLRRKRDKPSKSKWPDAMELYCRGCSECVGEDVCKPLSQFDFESIETAWEEVVSKGMESFCRRCIKPTIATQGFERKPAQDHGTCAWCKDAITANLTTTNICKTCTGLRIKCTKCSKTLKKNITKPLAAFSFERLLNWKKQRTLSSRANCLQCDDSDPKTTNHFQAYRWRQPSYDCSKCQKVLPPASFTPADLRTLEHKNQIYLAICDRCKAKSQEAAGALEMQTKCDHCKQKLPLSDFSPAMQRSTLSKKTCWACQHPECSGDGCKTRRPIPRVGKYTCEKCMYPPCHICKTTPRPGSSGERAGGSKYTVDNMPEWVCPGCKNLCQKCGGEVPKRDKGGRNRDYEAGLCDVCLYPPCPSCAKARPCKEKKYSASVRPIWTCDACIGTACIQCGEAAPIPKDAKKKSYGENLCDKCLYPPCPTCGKARPLRQKKYSASALPIRTCVACKKQSRDAALLA